jgi:selenocysteine lyase/cysteine desulfurase
VSAPKLPRRSFLGIAAVGAAACTTPARAPQSLAALAAATDKWAALRAEFALATDRIHLAGMLFTSYPRVVRDAIERYRGELDVDPVQVLEHDLETNERTNATLDAAARYLGVARGEIALTDSTTSGLALVYGGVTLAAGDEIVTTKHDHWVTHESLRLAAERTGASVRTVPLYEAGREARPETMAAALAGAISPATRVVAVTWVHSSTGVKTPVRAFADVVARANASRPAGARILLCVDGVHGFGVESAGMPELGCDVFIAGCHKWIFGPHGTGIVWARPDAWQRIRPTATPFHFGYVMAREYGGTVPRADGPTRTPGGFRAYEHRWALREAFDLHMALGKGEVEARIHELSLRLKTGLAALPNVTLHTPLEGASSAGIVCFEVRGLKPDAAVARLKAMRIVASTTPYQPSYARFSPGLTNTHEEIDRTIAAVRSLA